MSSNPRRMEPIAIVGMSGRFPHAASVGAFWENLRDGVEGITFFSEDELTAAGYDRESVRDPRFVPARGVLNEAEFFDAAFFGLSPREAEVMDPQHRVFLETAWSALEDAGYAPGAARDVGVYAGASMNSYLLTSIVQNPAAILAAGSYQAMLSNDKDYIATRVAYKLNLRGPAITVQTACSTSLVAVQMACRAIEAGDCGMALAGGVSINSPRVGGYMYEPGMILSPDGHCRAFDSRAKGTVAGEGVGVVVLKRLSDALADGDTIRAVILGAAINNDGAAKVGYTAPSVDGQTAAIAAAQAMAGVDPETITYIETHGTGTELGDPIEIAALTEAFGDTAKKGYCGIGSVKTNIGHLDAAAGVAGLIKAVLALEHRSLPPSLHYTQPNPNIDFDATPFYVNATLSDWTPPPGTPRRAGVSSFGIGGTNAHVVLEEAPPARVSTAHRPVQLLTLSAKTETALERSTSALAADLRANPHRSLADIAHTLHVGRTALPMRRTVVAATPIDAAAALEGNSAPPALTTSRERPVAFMFSGQGAQYVGMGRELYETEPVFRAEIDACASVLTPHLGFDLRDVLYPPAGEEARAGERLARTAVTQPALFTVEYALARTLMSWGIRPVAMIGHSIGEYVAACVAGAVARDDALGLVAARGRLMDVPGGTMLAVPLAEAALRQRLPATLSIAAINGPAMCAVSGPVDAIRAFGASLEAEGVTSQQLHVAAAFHSAMMDPVLPAFEAEASAVRFSPASIPFVSNVTGTWVTDEEVCEPAYWSRHLRGTVRFWDGIRTLAEEDVILLEIGPGRTLASLARPAAGTDAPRPILTTMRHPREERSDAALLQETLGRLWLAGTPIDWEGYHAGERRLRVPLPTCAFDGRRYWIPTGSNPAPSSAQEIGAALDRLPDRADWFYVRGWRRTPALRRNGAGAARWLLFADDAGVAGEIARELRQRGAAVTIARPSQRFERVSDDEYTVDPASQTDHERLVAAATGSGSPLHVLHCWSLADVAAVGDTADRDRGFYSVLHLVQAASDARNVDVRIGVVINGLYDVTGEPTFRPERATVLGPVLVAASEYAHIATRLLDVDVPASTDGLARIARQLIAELEHTAEPSVAVAYRGGYRWTSSHEPIRLPEVTEGESRLRDGGTYLITGGLGGIGLTFARHLAQRYSARLVLTARTPLPERVEWDRILEAGNAPATTLERIRAVRTLEADGADVLVAAADVTDASAMAAVFASARERFGAIHGVVHAAGVGNGGIIALKTRDRAEEVLAPKVAGTEVLHALLADSPADFLLLCSSISTVIATPGQVAYTAANAFLDAFGHANRDAATPIISVNWDVWSDTGMAVDVSGFGVLRGHHERHLEHGILAAEGADLFERILASGLSEVAVSTRDLPAVLTYLHSIGGTGAMIEAPYPNGAGSQNGASRLDTPAGAQAILATENGSGFPDQPVWAVQQVITEIWRELLGLETVGPNDDFFEAGGHSLLATQVASRIYRRLGVDVPLGTIFEARTVATLAARIDAMASELGPEREEIEL